MPRPILLLAAATAFALAAATATAVPAIEGRTMPVDKTPVEGPFAAAAAEHRRQNRTPEGRAWEQAFMPAHMQYWPDLYQRCVGEAHAAGIEEFSAVLVVGAGGVVERVVLDRDEAGLECFVRGFVGRQVPAPPEAPFHERIDFTLTEE